MKLPFLAAIQEGRLKGWAWPLCVFASVACVCVLIAFVASRGVTAAERLLRGDCSESFSSYALSVKGKAQLALCEAKRVEILKMTVPNMISYSELTLVAPVTYNYAVDMKGKWTLSASDGVLKVVAPKLELMPPAVDLQGAVLAVDKSVFDFGKAQKKLSELKDQLNSRLKVRGESPEAIKEVRETARAELAAFISAWLLNSRMGKVDSIQVRFADEERFPSLGFAPSSL